MQSPLTSTSRECLAFCLCVPLIRQCDLSRARDRSFRRAVVRIACRRVKGMASRPHKKEERLMASGRRLGPRRTRVLVGVAAAPFSIMVFGAQLQSPSPGPTPMGVLVVTKTDAITQAFLAGAGFRVFDMTDPAT